MINDSIKKNVRCLLSFGYGAAAVGQASGLPLLCERVHSLPNTSCPRRRAAGPVTLKYARVSDYRPAQVDAETVV